jgi:hypothetical protein
MNTAKWKKFRLLMYIVLTSSVWILVIAVLLVFLWPPGYDWRFEIQKLEYWNKISRIYSEVQTNLICFQFDEALRNTAKLTRLHDPPQEYINTALSLFWYAAGTCRFKPSVSPASSRGISNGDLYQTLERTLSGDVFTSHLIETENLIPLIDTVFYDRIQRNNAYAFVAGFARLQHPEKAAELLQPLSKLSADEFESLGLLAKTVIMDMREDYQGIIDLRWKLIPQVKSGLSPEEQGLLVYEVWAYVKMGEYEKARQLAKRYLDMDVLKVPKMREQLKIMVGIEKYPGSKSDNELLEELKQQLMQLNGQQ